MTLRLLHCGLVLGLSVGTAACAVQVQPPPAAPSGAPEARHEATAATADRALDLARGAGLSKADRAALLKLLSQLEQRLAATERELSRTAPEAHPARWEELVESRLQLMVALLRVEQALRLGVPLRFGGSRVTDETEGEPTLLPPRELQQAEQPVARSPIDRALDDAARRVAAARASRQTLRAGDEPTVYEKQTEYDFDSDVIDGSLLRPPAKAGKAAPARPTPGPTPVPTPPPAESPPVLRSPIVDLPPREPEKGSTVTASVVTPSAPPPNVLPVVSQHLGEMLECFPADQRRAGGVTLRVRTRLGRDGRLREPRISSDAGLPPLVAGCVTDVLAQIRVPPPPGGSRVISFPLRLRGER